MEKTVMKNIMVCGSGAMGSGIAQVSAAAGYKVYLWDLTTEIAQNSKNKIAAGLDRQIAQGKMTEEEKEALAGELLEQHLLGDLSLKDATYFLQQADITDRVNSIHSGLILLSGRVWSPLFSIGCVSPQYGHYTRKVFRFQCKFSAHCKIV